jgi:glyoxylase-like metal-dependent hydrolase (beta-lactamase superfamily II)
MRGFFQAAQAVAKAYSGRIRTYRSGEVTPGITAEPAVGHTPGHTVFRLSSGGRDVFSSAT